MTTRKKAYLTLSETNPCFLRGCRLQSVENTVEKGEIALNKRFLLNPPCFLHCKGQN